MRFIGLCSMLRVVGAVGQSRNKLTAVTLKLAHLPQQTIMILTSRQPPPPHKVDHRASHSHLCSDNHGRFITITQQLRTHTPSNFAIRVALPTQELTRHTATCAAACLLYKCNLIAARARQTAHTSLQPVNCHCCHPLCLKTITELLL